MNTAVEAAPPKAAARKRFVALDVFRGLTVFLMILVNTAGPGAPAYGQLVHARWIGFTLADAVFPAFLFAMGNALGLGAGREGSDRIYVARLFKRGAIIFVLGYLMYYFPFVEHGADGWALRPLATTRVPGVLQRIALCYVAAGLIVRWLRPWQVAVAGAALLLSYWAILVWGSAPGMAFDKHANIGTLIDLHLLGPGHLYKKDAGFDPEGLLGTLPATVNVLAGYLVGLEVQRGPSLRQTVNRLAVMGVTLIAGGLAWSFCFPIAKKLWTGSFTCLTIGIDCLVIAGVILWTDIARRREGVRFFTIFGRNPLAIYLFSELFVIVLQMIPLGGETGVYDWFGKQVFQPIAPGPLGSLLCAFAYTMVCWALGWWMDRRGLILKA